jgi:hypothetical protein
MCSHPGLAEASYTRVKSIKAFQKVGILDPERPVILQVPHVGQCHTLLSLMGLVPTLLCVPRRLSTKLRDKIASSLTRAVDGGACDAELRPGRCDRARRTRRLIASRPADTLSSSHLWRSSDCEFNLPRLALRRCRSRSSRWTGHADAITVNIFADLH